MNKVLNENERLLEQAISKDIVNIVVTYTVNNAYESMHESERCFKLETELQKTLIKWESYDKLFKQYTTLEKHCISLEVDTQLEQEIFQREYSFSQQSVPNFDHLFAINELNAQFQEKDKVIKKLKERIKSLSRNMKEEKIKQKLEEIETINIELDHRVTKLIGKNEHLKQTYKQLYDSIKSSRIRSKEHYDDLIKQVNIKSAGNFDLNASLQEKVLVIIALKDTLRKLKGKSIVDEAVILHPIDPELLKIDVTSLAPKLQNNRTTHYDYRNACPLTRITTTDKVPLRKPIPLESNTPKPVVVQIVLWYLDSGCSKHMNGDRSQVTNFVNKFLGTVKFGNDHMVKIMDYGDYHIGNVTISKVYFVKGLRHNLFCVGQFCDSELEVAFRQHTFFIRNLEDHLCSACAMGKSMKKSHKPKSEDTNQEKLYLLHMDLHMDLYGAMRVENVNGKKYILVIVDDYSRFTWDKCLRSKDEAPDFIIKILNMIQVRLKVPVRSPKVIAPIAEVIVPEHAESTGSPSSTTVDQDAPSPSNDSFFGMSIQEVAFGQASSMDSIHRIVHPDH
nr:integrase, catalytic region, zinc finger, CCHC-type, peptidase aspartic, catalytic [Tanacetum cinerariifolium]